MIAPLPIDAVLPDLIAVLRDGAAAVLQAPPGAGKTTKVPLALLDQEWAAGKTVVMLEPRRLATRAAAQRMAAMLDQPVGATVGYRMRLDSKIGPDTRIEVVTEGVLTRRLQDDPELAGVAAVIFDEFHERSLNADLGLALCLETQAALRPDLRLLAMSATLDGAAVARLLGGAPVVSSEGRSFPVETRYLEREPVGRLEETVAAAVLRGLAEQDGDILVFLPGEAEIRRTEALLRERASAVRIAPLYGNLPQDQQDLALRPGSQRRVVLATAIAETSLTIEGVRIVVDSGLMRVPRFDPGGGMTRLQTLKVSRASADQRRGRAGRLGPGVCYRLWTEAAQRTLIPQTPPEILQADLAPLALDLAQWGVAEPGALAWLDPPPAAAFAQAGELLRELGAVDEAGRITGHGRAMARLPMHPRLAHMVLKGKDIGLGGVACDLAALLSERDLLRTAPGERDADLRLRLEALRGLTRGLAVDRGALQRVRDQGRQWRRQLRIAGGAEADDIERAGVALALAYPDRIARRRPGGEPRYQLANGRGAFFAEHEPLSAEDWLAIAELDGDKREARIFLAAPLSAADLERHFEALIAVREDVSWDSREQAVRLRRQRRLGALVLKDEPLTAAAPERVTAAMIQGIRELGLASLPWSKAVLQWRARVAFLRRVEGGNWPDLSDQALLDTLEDWLDPFLDGVTRRAHLSRLDLDAILKAQLDWPRQKALDELAPTHIAVPSGSRVPVDYDSGDEPVLAVRLQEMFGLAATPRIAGGRVPLLLHLLSPARRPVQVTRDLASFWANAYRQVKADLKGQYPKHSWPDDPLQAEPTARAKPRS